MANLRSTIVNGILRVIGKIKTDSLETDTLNGLSTQEISYLDGVLSPIQPQIDSKPTFAIGVCDTAIGTAAKDITIANFTLVVGSLIQITFTVGHSSNTMTLNINGTGAKPVRIAGINVSNTTAAVAVGGTLYFVYDGTNYNILGSQRTYDNDTFDRYRISIPFKAGADIIYKYKICITGYDGLMYPIVTSNPAAATDVNMTVSTRKLPIGGRIQYMSASGNIAANATTYDMYTAHPGIPVLYSLNVASLTLYSPIYLVGIPQNDGTFILDTTSLTSFFAFSLPTQYDGKIYIYLGIAVSTSTMEMTEFHPIYYHDGENITLYSDALPVNGIIDKSVYLKKNTGAVGIGLNSVDGSAVDITLDREGKSSWKIINELGELKFQNDWKSNTKDVFEDKVTVSPDTGNVTLIGEVTSPKFIGDLTGSASKVGMLTPTDIIANNVYLNGTELTTGANFFSLKTPGVYYTNSKDVAMSCLNKPTTGVTADDEYMYAYGFVVYVTAVSRVAGVIATAVQEVIPINQSWIRYSRYIVSMNTEYPGFGGWNKLSDGGNAKTVNTYTVNASVPSNAKFTDTTYSAATTTVAGLMSAEDKVKLNSISANANAYTLPVAGATLGGVKSGTDITVDASGNVSVNDNSHGHTINNLSWPVSYNLACGAPTANNQEWSIDMPDTTFTGCYWHVYTAKGSKGTILKADNDTGRVTAQYGIDSGPIIASYLTVTAQDANEGGEIKLNGGGTNLPTILDNNAGDFRIINGTTVNMLVNGATGDASVRGTFYATKVFNASFNDYAEWFEKEDINETFEPGDIVTWVENGVTKANQYADPLVVGVFSDSYGHIVGGEALDNMEDNIKKFVPVGLSGRLDVKVVGKVSKGNLIIASGIPGVGIVSKSPTPGTVIGKAISEKISEDIGLIKVLIFNI